MPTLAEILEDLEAPKSLADILEGDMTGGFVPAKPEPEQEGQWEGWMKPSIKEAWEGVKATPEAAYSLLSGVATWPVTKAFGVGKLAAGGTAKEAREVEAQAGEYFGYHPSREQAVGATEIVGKGIEAALTPAKMAGEGATALVGERAGYLTELAAELFTFKMGHGLAKTGKGALRERSIAKSTFGKRMGELDAAQRKVVYDVAKEMEEGRNLGKVIDESDKDPLEKAYETQKDIWIGNKDIRLLDAKRESSFLKKSIRLGKEYDPFDPKSGKGPKISHKQAMDYDAAIQLYIDTPVESITQKVFDKLSKEQQRIVTLAQNLPPEVLEVAERIKKSYEDVGLDALDADVIKNVRDNYARRAWTEGKGKGKAGKKFGTTTPHAKARKYETIIDGWLEGKELETKGATENLRKYKDEVTRAIEDKRFMEELRKFKDIDGNSLLSTQQTDGYVRVEHPNFKVWEWAGKAEEGKTYGKNFFITEDGALFERRELYAPKKQAKNLNNIMGISKIQDIPGAKTLTKFNEVTKSWILQSSLYHHQAFMRSYYLPGLSPKKFGEIGIRQAYKDGIKSIEQSEPSVMLGVRKGLTLGLKQDWVESIAKESTWVGKVVDKVGGRGVKEKINSMRDRHVDFLFGEFGAGLKAKAFEIEFREQIKKYPNQDEGVIAGRVARLINDDFGGLHLGRIGRNPTLQHVMRLGLLAPDWTESNIRTMAKTIKNAKNSRAEKVIYRKFWGGVVVKGMGLTAIANYLLAGGDIETLKENYKRAWDEGNLRWTEVDITPIYKALGGETENRKYFTIFGHFRDPAKFMTNFVRSLKHKASVAASMGLELLTGADWSGRGFTTLSELLETGETVKWGKGKEVNYEHLPSFAISQLVGTQPIQIQNYIAWLNGEMEAFDAVSRGMGFMTSTTYEEKQNQKGLSNLSGLGGL